MKFRPCIDIHNGKVKQVKGASLSDSADTADENFVSDREAFVYADFYKEKGLSGGHVIVLNSPFSEFYGPSVYAARGALAAYPGGMQYGGGVNNENAATFLDAGASHVIVTSFVFRDGKLNYDNLAKLQKEIGKEKIVLDLSCRKKIDGKYYVVTDRWQMFTDLEVTVENLKSLSGECSEFLVHAVDVEGKAAGIDVELLRILSGVGVIPVTYAGGVKDLQDIDRIFKEGKGKVDFTVGSALSIFGGSLTPDAIMGRTEQLSMGPIRFFFSRILQYFTSSSEKNH